MTAKPASPTGESDRSDLERVSGFVAFATQRLHGIASRTQSEQVASEVLRLNDAVRRGAQGRIAFGQHPQDFAAVLVEGADATNRDGAADA